MKSWVRGVRILGINLVLMIDVLMLVLIFFVILIMFLIGRVIVDLELLESVGGFVKEEDLFF